MSRPRSDPWSELARLPDGPGEPGEPYVSAEDWCDRSGIDLVLRCPECGRYYLAAVPCMRLDCATCYARVRARRGARGMERIGGRPLAHVVLTFPASWWAHLSPARVAWIRPVAARALLGWARSLGLGGAGCSIAVHPCGDKCPCGYSGDQLGRLGTCPECGRAAAWKPHLDCLIPLAGLAADPVQAWVSTSIRWRRTRGEIDQLRQAWGEVIGGVGRALHLPIPEVPVCWYGHAITAAQRGHRIAYSWRPFPAWYGALHGRCATVRPFGLLSPGASRTADEDRRLAVEDWRLSVAGRPDREPGIPCPSCGDDTGAVLDHVDRLKRGGRLWRRLSWIPRLEALGGRPAPAPAGAAWHVDPPPGSAPSGPG